MTLLLAIRCDACGKQEITSTLLSKEYVTIRARNEGWLIEPSTIKVLGESVVVASHYCPSCATFKKGKYDDLEVTA